MAVGRKSPRTFCRRTSSRFVSVRSFAFAASFRRPSHVASFRFAPADLCACTLGLHGGAPLRARAFAHRAAAGVVAGSSHAAQADEDTRRRETALAGDVRLVVRSTLTTRMVVPATGAPHEWSQRTATSSES